MTATNKLALELLQNAAANQTLANITFAQLNQLVQATVVDKDLAAPPSTPGDESLYIVGSPATGLWAGHENQLAYWLTTTGAWQFVSAKSGWEVAVQDELDSSGQPARYGFNGTAWTIASGSGGGFSNPMTTIRDMIVAGVGGAPTRLPGPTSEGMVLTRIGNALAWAIATGFANPMTAAGDLLVGGAAGAASRLAIGAEGRVLTVVSGALAWVTPSTPPVFSGGTLTSALNEAPQSSWDVSDPIIGASAVAGSNTITVVGAGPLTGMAAAPTGSYRKVVLGMAMQINNSVNFGLFGGANIQGRAGDILTFRSVGSAQWSMTDYAHVDGTPLITPADPNKVDKVAGLQLSQENYTTLEKAKLAGLDPNHFRGMFATLAALQAAVPAANIGDYAFVDPASGADVVQYLWDNNDSKWVYNGPTAGVTAAQVKTLYESNANTNAYTDSEKAKLAAIAAGAQVNTVTSVAGRTGAVVLAKADVGLPNADNTADNVKPVSAPQQTAIDAAITGNKRKWNGGFNRYNTSQTLTIAQLGRVIWFTAPGLTCTMPAPATGAAGDCYTIRNGTTGTLTITTPSGSIYPEADNLATQSYVLGPREWVEVGTDGANWCFNLRGRLDQASPLDSPAFTSSAQVAGPVKPGQYTLTTLPSASAFSGYEIDVTNATGGSKRCRSNGTVWQILNTTTTVS